MTERMRKAADAFRDHSLDCKTCRDPNNSLRCCDAGEKLLAEFYEALREAAREEE